MLQPKHHPPLSDLINSKIIPGEIAFIENTVSDLLETVTYTNYIHNNSPKGDIQNYALTLTMPKQGIEFFWKRV